jgi:hypothetical protein
MQIFFWYTNPFKRGLVMKILMRQMRLFGTAVFTATILSACGGGAGPNVGGNTTSPVPTSPAQGLWKGTTGIAPNDRSLTNLVFSDGSYYLFYSAAGNPNSIAGVVQGTGTVSGTKFTSSNTKDFDFESSEVSGAAMSVDFTSKNTFNGSMIYAAGTSSFTSTYSTYFETKPTLAVITGTFNGSLAPVIGAAQDATLTVSTAGTLSGGYTGCAITGSISQRNDGNAYNVSLQFGASPCLFANQTLSGVAYFDAAIGTISVMAPNAGRTDGVIFMGSGSGLGAVSGSFDPSLVGIWGKTNMTETFNADGTYSLFSTVLTGGGCSAYSRIESTSYGTFSTSGSTLTLNKTSGSISTWSCYNVFATTPPASTTTSGVGSPIAYTFGIVGSGTGATLSEDYGTGSIILTKQ